MLLQLINYNFFNLKSIFSSDEPIIGMQPTLSFPIFNEKGERIFPEDKFTFMDSIGNGNVALEFSIDFKYHETNNSLDTINSHYNILKTEVILEKFGMKNEKGLCDDDIKRYETINLPFNRATDNNLYFHMESKIFEKDIGNISKGSLLFLITSNFSSTSSITPEKVKETIKNLRIFMGLKDVKETNKYAFRFTIFSKKNENPSTTPISPKPISSYLFTLTFNEDHSEIILTEVSSDKYFVNK